MVSNDIDLFLNIRLINYNSSFNTNLIGGIFLSREEEIIHLTEKTLEKEEFKPSEFRSAFQYLEAVDRINGKEFSLDNYVEALIFSLLSYRRKWKRIDELRDEIGEIFENFNFKRVKILAENPTKLINDIKGIRAGNYHIHSQMKALKGNLVVLEKLYDYIESDYKKEVTIKEIHKYTIEYVKLIYKRRSEYKLNHIGIALAAEFLKNIGIPIAKPDTHILRTLGKKRLGILSVDDEECTDKEKIESLIEFYSFVQKMTTNAVEVIYYDSLFWTFCAEDYGEICAKVPRCKDCLLTDLCNYKK